MKYNKQQHCKGAARARLSPPYQPALKGRLEMVHREIHTAVERTAHYVALFVDPYTKAVIECAIGLNERGARECVEHFARAVYSMRVSADGPVRLPKMLADRGGERSS